MFSNLVGNLVGNNVPKSIPLELLTVVIHKATLTGGFLCNNNRLTFSYKRAIIFTF